MSKHGSPPHGSVDAPDVDGVGVGVGMDDAAGVGVGMDDAAGVEDGARVGVTVAETVGFGVFVIAGVGVVVTAGVGVCEFAGVGVTEAVIVIDGVTVAVGVIAGGVRNGPVLVPPFLIPIIK